MAAAGESASAAAEVGSNEDLLEEIFLRLPDQTSLLTAALVCRAWLRLVRRIRHPRALVGHFFISQYRNPIDTFFLESDCSPSAAARFSGAVTQYDADRGNVLDSRDGLILLYSHSHPARVSERRFSVHIYNPLAGPAAVGIPFPVHPDSRDDFRHNVAVRRGNGCAFEVLYLAYVQMAAHIFLYTPLAERWSLVLLYHTMEEADVKSCDFDIRMLATRRRLFLLCRYKMRKWMVMLNIHTLQVLATILLPSILMYFSPYSCQWNLLVLDDGYEVSGENENEVEIVIFDDRKFLLRFFSRSGDEWLFKKMIALPENITRDRGKWIAALYANHRIVLLHTFWGAVYRLCLDSMEAEKVHIGTTVRWFRRVCPYTSRLFL